MPDPLPRDPLKCPRCGGPKVHDDIYCPGCAAVAGESIDDPPARDYPQAFGEGAAD